MRETILVVMVKDCKRSLLCKTKFEVSQLFKLGKSLKLIFDFRFLICTVGNKFYLKGKGKIKPYMHGYCKLLCSNCIQVLITQNLFEKVI